MASRDQRARAWITKALGSERHAAGKGGNGRQRRVTTILRIRGGERGLHGGTHLITDS